MENTKHHTIKAFQHTQVITEDNYIQLNTDYRGMPLSIKIDDVNSVDVTRIHITCHDIQFTVITLVDELISVDLPKGYKLHQHKESLPE